MICIPRTLDGRERVPQRGFLHGFAGTFYEQLVYREDGQLLTSTFTDCLCPSAMQCVDPKVGHVESPSPLTLAGAKGGGESSAETTPAALANAIADALSPLGAAITGLPIPPEKLWRTIREHKEGR